MCMKYWRNLLRFLFYKNFFKYFIIFTYDSIWKMCIKFVKFTTAVDSVFFFFFFFDGVMQKPFNQHKRCLKLARLLIIYKILLQVNTKSSALVQNLIFYLKCSSTWTNFFILSYGVNRGSKIYTLTNLLFFIVFEEIFSFYHKESTAVVNFTHLLHIFFFISSNLKIQNNC